MRVAALACRPAQRFPPETEASGLSLRSACAGRDASIIAGLAEEAATMAGAGRPGAGPEPRGRGLVAELASRPGREVEAWLAITQAVPTAGDRVVGLISLVAARSATGIRHSIGWLLVHPAARRRGVARALVARACRRAAELGAEMVWVECRSDWADAMAFWRAVGFGPIPATDMIDGSAAPRRNRLRTGSQESP